jgi:hypothetical protein
MSDEQQPEVLAVPEQLEQPELGRSIDLVRERLTTQLLWVFIGTIASEVVFAGIAMLTGHDVTPLREALHDVIPAETGLLGAAIGYYFGEKARR